MTVRLFRNAASVTLPITGRILAFTVTRTPGGEVRIDPKPRHRTDHTGSPHLIEQARTLIAGAIAGANQRDLLGA